MRLRLRQRIKTVNRHLNKMEQLFTQFSLLDSAMHHMGCMAALNRSGFRAKALNLAWFRAHSAIVKSSPLQVFSRPLVFRVGITLPV